MGELLLIDVPVDVLVDVDVYVKQPSVVSSRAEDQDRTWTVREIADDLGVTTRSLRFWEAEGLIVPERRGTVRVFHPRDHARVRLILRGKRFGMSLPEIRELVEMYDGASSSERRQLELLLARLGEIRLDLRQRASDLRRLVLEVDVAAEQARARLRTLEGSRR
jgi:DNA-binding transcriptional MerR regulator